MKTTWDFPAGLEPIISWARAADLEIWCVGGWVRDTLLELPAWDADLCGPGLPEDLWACLPGDASVTLHTRDAGLGTVELHTSGGIYEYTAFRRESYRPGGAHRPQRVALGATLEEDAVRRDFSANALYVRLSDGAFRDPTGGLEDLRQNRLRTTRLPEDVLSEDGLRLLRLVRQMAELAFEAEEVTWRAACQRVSLLQDIAPERLREELFRILLADMRHPGKHYALSPVVRGLRLLEDLGAWRYLAPAYDALGDHEKRWQAASLTPPDPALRLACLWAGLAPEDLSASCETLRLTRIDTARIRFLADTALKKYEDHSFKVLLAKKGRDGAGELVRVRRALTRAGLADATMDEEELMRDMEASGVPFSLREVRISGQTLAGLCGGPSPKVGELKDALWRHCILHPGDNDPEILLRLARERSSDR